MGILGLNIKHEPISDALGIKDLIPLLLPQLLYRLDKLAITKSVADCFRHGVT